MVRFLQPVSRSLSDFGFVGFNRTTGWRAWNADKTEGFRKAMAYRRNVSYLALFVLIFARSSSSFLRTCMYWFTARSTLRCLSSLCRTPAETFLGRINLL